METRLISYIKVKFIIYAQKILTACTKGDNIKNVAARRVLISNG